MNEQHNEEAISKLLELSKKEKNVKQKQRYDVVLLFLEGYERKEISAVLHMPKRTSDHYIYLYQQGGADALLIKKQPGYKKKLTDEQEKELLNIISTQTPYEAGIGVFANWTAPLACRLVAERFKVEYSERGMRDLFKRVGLSYTRPTYTLAKADPEKQEAFKTEFETIKKTFE